MSILFKIFSIFDTLTNYKEEEMATWFVICQLLVLTLELVLWINTLVAFEKIWTQLVVVLSMNMTLCYCRHQTSYLTRIWMLPANR